MSLRNAWANDPKATWAQHDNETIFDRSTSRDNIDILRSNSMAVDNLTWIPGVANNLIIVRSLSSTAKLQKLKSFYSF